MKQRIITVIFYAVARLVDAAQRVTISGLSSGADFAIQFHVSHSALVSGAAAFAGQPYHCAVVHFPSVQMYDPLVSYVDPSVPYCRNCPNGTTLVYDHCKNVATGRFDSGALISIAREHESAGLIDSLENLRRSRVFLYRGGLDRTYLPGSVDGRFYQALGAAVDSEYIDKISSQHAWPTEDYGVGCGQTGVFEICGVDGTGVALQSLYGNALKAPVETIVEKNLERFDQTPFRGVDPLLTMLDDYGYLYTPAACRYATEGSALCDVHVALHGCNVDNYYEDAVRNLSINRWAEANNIIVLWPKLKPRVDSAATTQQQQGCWDAYGQTTPLYATKAAPQISAVYGMIQTILY